MSELNQNRPRLTEQARAACQLVGHANLVEVVGARVYPWVAELIKQTRSTNGPEAVQLRSVVAGLESSGWLTFWDLAGKGEAWGDGMQCWVWRHVVAALNQKAAEAEVQVEVSACASLWGYDIADDSDEYMTELDSLHVPVDLAESVVASVAYYLQQTAES